MWLLRLRLAALGALPTSDLTLAKIITPANGSGVVGFHRAAQYFTHASHNFANIANCS